MLKLVKNKNGGTTKKEGSAKETTKEKRSRIGRRSRNKGSSFERVIAKLFQDKYGIEFVRTPQSGGFAKNKQSEGFKGDIVPVSKDTEFGLHVECKNTKSWSLPKWFEQAESDAPKGRVPVVIFHKHGTSKNYIALSLEDFFSLVGKDKIFGKEG